ncbi:MAG: alpha/beta hydrolase [Saprospiraceae bacterium]|nr:alpha/beta hydrolase [Pyrinomonadaceae bacterium]
MRFKNFIFLFLIVSAFSVVTQGQKPADKWAKFEGTKIRYYDIGNAKSKNALVLVHCWTCNVEFWKDNYNAFPNHRVIAMDLPGHGGSDKPKIDYSMEYFAKSVDAVMKKAGVKKAVLAGHSMGTPIIRRYYELFPEKTAGLIIVDGALLPFGPRAEVDKFFAPLFKDYKGGAATFIDGMLQTAYPEVRPLIRSSMLATPDYVGLSAMKLMTDDAYAVHGRIEVPVLAVMAPSDFWPANLKDQYTSIAPKIDFQMWTGVSHFLQLEKPKEFNEQVNLFISKNKLLPNESPFSRMEIIIMPQRPPAPKPKTK